MYILEKMNGILGIKPTYIDGDEHIFKKLAHFIIDLDPGQLTDEELEEAGAILDLLDIEPKGIGVSEQERRPGRRAGRTPQDKRQYMKQYYRQNKGKIKRRKRKLMRTAEYRQRARKRERMARAGKTPTGKRKVRYNV